MISVLKDEVPQYLRSSPLYDHLFSDDEFYCAGISVEIPEDCLKQNPSVQSEADLRELLLTVRYWLIPECVETGTDIVVFARRNYHVFNSVISEFAHDFPLLTKLSAALKPCYGFTRMGSAAKHGSLQLMQYLREKGVSWDAGKRRSCVTTVAAEYGHVDCLRYTYENGCYIVHEASELAAQGGHLDCLKYAYHRWPRFHWRKCELAVRSGNLACIKLIIDTQCVSNRVMASCCADVASSGDIKMLAYLLSVGGEATVQTAISAASNDQLECLKLLHSVGCPFSSSTMYHAVRAGNIRCVEFLHSVGCAWDAETLQPVASTQSDWCCKVNDLGKLPDLANTFMYAAEHGCPLTPTTMTAAAQFGSVAFVKYLHGRGVALDANAFSFAVARGHIECVRYFLDNGYAASTRDYLAAVQHGRLSSVQCLHEHGIQWDTTVTNAAVQWNQPAVLHYLLVNGCAISEGIVLRAASLPHAACLKCLHQHGFPLTEAVVMTAVTSNAIDCLAYALSQGCRFVPDAAIAAAYRGNLECLKWLHRHGAVMTPDIVCAALVQAKTDCVSWEPDATIRYPQHGPNYSFECVKYAVRNGCSVNAALIADSELYADKKVLGWLREQILM